jgi:hypothetical protein
MTQARFVAWESPFEEAKAWWKPTPQSDYTGCGRFDIGLLGPPAEEACLENTR